MGWDFVGRLRNQNLVRFAHTSTWQLSNILYKNAKGTPKYLGHGVLTNRLKVPAHFVIYKGKKKNRHRFNKNKTCSDASQSKRYAKAHNEPWLLVTSLLLSADMPKQITQIFRQRMRIEENIRDTKCTRI